MSAERLMRRISARSRAGSILLVCALLGGVLAATIGAGYVASRPLLDTAGAYLAKGTGIAFVNALSHSVEAEALGLAPGKNRIEVVVLPDGQVWVVDNESKQARKLDGGTMHRGPQIRLGEGDATVVAASDGGYLVDGDRVSLLGSDGKRLTTARLPAMFADHVVPDANEGVWVLSTDSIVTHVVGNQIREQVRDDQGIQQLTVADHRPVGLTAAGQLLDLTAAPPRPITEDPVPSGDVKLGSAKGPGRWVLVLNPSSGELTATDIRTGETRPLRVRGGTDLGQPVQVDNFVYVPDYDHHLLRVLNLATGEQLADIEVPGSSERFSVEVRKGRVWANDQFDRRAVVVKHGNNPEVVDKGEGTGLSDTHGESDKPPDKPDEGPPQEQDTPADTPDESAGTVEVPDIEAGTTIGSACAQLGAASLVCTQVPIGDGGEPGTVPDNPTNPPAGTRVSRGSTVVVNHYGPAQVPSVVGLFAEDACTQIRSAGLTCSARARPDLAPDPSKLDVVTSQNPEAGGDVPPGGEISLTYYNKVELDDYVRRNGEGACADIEQRYHTVRCRTVYDRSEAQTNQRAGTVHDQKPDAGATIQTADVVVLHVVTPSKGVPNVGGMSRENACATLSAEGYICQPVEDAPVARQIVVASQEPPPGTKKDSGPVTIHLPPGGFVSLVLCRRGDGDYVFRMHVDQCQREFSENKGPVGTAYAANVAAHQQLVPLYEHYCIGTREECRGFRQNRYYSRNPTGLDGNWRKEDFSYSVVNTCTLTPGGTDGDSSDGLTPIYQVVYLESGASVYNYTITDNPQYVHPTLGKAPDGSEFLGCVWRP
jgi:beta-lactam-binding protein with PASTA domain